MKFENSMGNRLEQLMQCVQTTNQFVANRINRYPDFLETTRELEKISAFSNLSQLTVQIFSRFPPLARGFYNFLNSNQSLLQFYQARVSDFPTIWQAVEPNLPPAIVLQANSATRQTGIRYELLNNQSLLIGRDRQRLSQDFRSQNSQLIALSAYNKVSGIHAQIQAVTSPGSTTTTWQICDLNSTNGTYINGQRIQDCKILQPGDRITLAYPSASEKAPEFIFQSQSSPSIGNIQSNQVIDCDLVCLVIAPQQLWSNEEKKFIDAVNKAQVSGLFIIADTSGASPQILQKLNSDLTALESWLRVQYPSLTSNTFITHLELYPFHSNTTPTSVNPSVRQRLDWFSQQVLLILAKTKSQEIIFNRIARKVSYEINRIEQVINEREKELRAEIERTEQLLNHCSWEDWREKVRTAFKQVVENKEDFFRYARTELGRARTDLSSPFIPDSLMQRIEKYTDTLQPVVTRHKGQVCIQLQSGNTSDTHQALISFCQTQLIQWATEEWTRFCNVYENGGLNQLLQDSYATLNTFPALALSNPFNSPTLQIDVCNSIQGCFVEMQNNSSYYEGSADAFGSAARIGMQVAMTAGMAFINPVSAVIQGGSLVTSLVSLIGSRLSSSQIQNLKLEQAVTGLKRTASSYYQTIARYMLENRVMPTISVAIDTEERKFRKAIEAADKQITDYLNELRLVREGYRERQQNLNQDRAALEQIKRFRI